MDEWRCNSTHSYPRHWMKMVDFIASRFTSGQEPPVGPLNRVGHFGEEINPLPLPGFETQTAMSVDVTLLTMLSRFLLG
jgi:hypothetical protein